MDDESRGVIVAVISLVLAPVLALWKGLAYGTAAYIAVNVYTWWGGTLPW